MERYSAIDIFIRRKHNALFCFRLFCINICGMPGGQYFTWAAYTQSMSSSGPLMRNSFCVYVIYRITAIKMLTLNLCGLRDTQKFSQGSIVSHSEPKKKIVILPFSDRSREKIKNKLKIKTTTTTTKISIIAR